MGKNRHPRQTRHRQPSVPGVYRRSRRDQLSGEIAPHGKYLPRMKPPREQLSSGEKLIHDHLPLGGYDTAQDAKIVRDIAAYYYGKAEGELALPNGQAFSIPSMSEQEKRSLHGIEKRKWVCRQAREVYEDFKTETLKAATSMRNHGALVSSEAATTVAASSAEIHGSQQQQLVSPSPEDSALDPIFGDLQIDNFDTRNGVPTTFDLLSLPSLSWDEGEVLRSTSEETTSREVKQLRESQSLELQEQLGEAHMQILELQREMECVKSKLQQHCFCLHEPYWIP